MLNEKSLNAKDEISLNRSLFLVAELRSMSSFSGRHFEEIIGDQSVIRRKNNNNVLRAVVLEACVTRQLVTLQGISCYYVRQHSASANSESSYSGSADESSYSGSSDESSEESTRIIPDPPMPWYPPGSLPSASSSTGSTHDTTAVVAIGGGCEDWWVCEVRCCNGVSLAVGSGSLESFRWWQWVFVSSVVGVAVFRRSVEAWSLPGGGHGLAAA
ncbi:hypothetical protein LOK49_LG08G00864 [Camellia lanceoleosa]|uniref:Uncharacterized protein n=1 Tax=Camellia lanceoleosa TaxID=1840588 RepID=A0ACC0GPT5_9ERIC|nr:hypothetical protein LOK49_LG08G00864 [Camellia lanceoleosa]